jgi:hypothetical protein
MSSRFEAVIFALMFAKWRVGGSSIPGKQNGCVESFVIPASRKIMLRIFHGLTFGVSQPIEHAWCRFPANFSVGPQVPHRVSRLLEFVQDLGDESMPAFEECRIFSLLARDIYPEFQLFGHPQFHMSARPSH